MSKIGFKLSWKVIAALAVCAGIGSNMAFAKIEEMPQNQREFDAFLRLASPAKRNAAGHAFDNGAAQLFWFTDLNAAKKQAKLEKKPILSLRLLGRLSDEYSCANSRFFRVIFYPQAQINPLLRDQFVLHWSSERAVPTVSIDMGDGRVVRRTLTGNSAHYLLDENGRPLDVMPGVVTPIRFANWLQSGAALNRSWNQTTAQEREAFLSDWHRAQMNKIWREIEPKRGEDEKWVITQVEKSLELNPIEKNADARTAAEIAAPLFVSKSIGEIPILDATRLFGSGARITPVGFSGFRFVLSNAKTPRPAILDEATRAHIKAMNPPLAPRAASQNTGAGKDENLVAGAQFQTVSQTETETQTEIADPFNELIARFETSIQEDDRMSLARFQVPIHASFVQGQASDFDAFNRKIYSRLFLTPKSDPWLGLAPAGDFTALQNGGLFEARPSSP